MILLSIFLLLVLLLLASASFQLYWNSQYWDLKDRFDTVVDLYEDALEDIIYLEGCLDDYGHWEFENVF